MRADTRLRAVVALFATLLLWIGWRQVGPAPRLGDVPYVPTRDAVVDRMLELAEIDAEDVVFDLGSGDGRIVIRAAQRFGARARGFELDPLLVRESRAAAARAGVDDRVAFIEGDLFDADLRDATAVTLFLLPTVNLRLRPRLLADLAPGTPVVSHMWDMGVWSPDRHEVLQLDPPAELYLWIIPAAAGGVWQVDLDGAPPAGRARLRLLQRFQELEGDLSWGEATLPVTGRVDGDRILVRATRDHPLLPSFSLRARVSGDSLVGSATVGAGTAPLEATASRVPARAAGIWDIAPAGAGDSPRATLTLQQEGRRWTARLAGLAPAPAEPGRGTLPGYFPVASAAGDGEDGAREAVVWGASVLFDVPWSAGAARRVSYYGLVEGDTMSGFANAGGALVPWTARRRPEDQ